MNSINTLPTFSDAPYHFLLGIIVLQVQVTSPPLEVKLFEDRWPTVSSWCLNKLVPLPLSALCLHSFFVFTQMKSLLIVVQFNCWAKELQVFYSPRCPRINPANYLSLIVHFTLHCILHFICISPFYFHWNPTRQCSFLYSWGSSVSEISKFILLRISRTGFERSH